MQYQYDLMAVVEHLNEHGPGLCPFCEEHADWQFEPELVRFPSWNPTTGDISASSDISAVLIKCKHCHHIELLRLQEIWLATVTVIEESPYWRARSGEPPYRDV